MSIYNILVNSTIIPWRLRNQFELWTESRCRISQPKLYRWLHFGIFTDPAKPLTNGPNHHFFGYYDKSPWNASGDLLLAHETTFNDRSPNTYDSVTIGIIDRRNDNHFIPLADSFSWNWQQVTMLQWHPTDPKNLFVHNDRRKKRFVGIVRDLSGKIEDIYDLPIYALLPDGKTGFSLNFSRLAVHRPGYGYAGIQDPFLSEQSPINDGLWKIDLVSGKQELIVNLRELSTLNPMPTMDGAWHYINHIQPSKGGKRIAFFHLWHKTENNWEVRLYSCRPDGSDLTCLLDTGVISHFDWRDDDTILVWAKQPYGPPRFLLINHRGEFHTFAEKVITEDGHCSYSPDGRWILNDTYPDRHDMRTLMLVDALTGRRIDLARFYSPKSRWWGEIRCDLHPRWSPDGKEICIDSLHDGSRQMYVIDMMRYLE